MIELTDALQSYTGVMVLTALFMVAALVGIAMSGTINKRARHTFIISTATIIVVVIADWFSVLVDGNYPELRTLHAISTAVAFTLAPTIPAVLVAAIYPNKRTYIIRLILAAHALVEVLSIFCGFVFWIDEENLYHRGDFYFLYILSYAFSCVYLIVQSIRASREFQSSNIIALSSIILCVIVGIVIQLIFPAAHTSWTAIAMGASLYFIYYSDITLRNDSLTKLLSRRSYEETLANPPLPCAVVLLDVNDFKSINDTYGHSYGDTCLIAMSGIIKQTFEKSGKCFRVGGDEFVVIMNKNLDRVEELTESFKDAVARARENDPHMPSASVGYALADAGCTDIASVITSADITMYGNKRAAKEHHHIPDPIYTQKVM